MAIQLTVNGKPKELSGPVNLTAFLRLQGIKSQFVAVGYNGIVLNKEEFPQIILQDGDVVEIVRPVGGGC